MGHNLYNKQSEWNDTKAEIRDGVKKMNALLDSSSQRLENDLRNKRIFEFAAKKDIVNMYSSTIKISKHFSDILESSRITSSIHEEDFKFMQDETNNEMALLLKKFQSEFKKLFGFHEDINNHVDRSGNPTKKLFGLF